MAAHLGVLNLNGLAPATGYANESTSDKVVEVVKIRDEMGVTVRAKPKKMVTQTVSIKGKGTVDFALVAAGAITIGTLFIKQVKQEESDEYPSFEMEGVIHSNPP